MGVAGLGMLGIWRRVRYGVALGAAEGAASGELGLRGLVRRGRVVGVFASAAGSGSPSGWLAIVEETVGFVSSENWDLGHWRYSTRTWFSLQGSCGVSPVEQS